MLPGRREPGLAHVCCPPHMVLSDPMSLILQIAVLVTGTSGRCALHYIAAHVTVQPSMQGLGTHRQGL